MSKFRELDGSLVISSFKLAVGDWCVVPGLQEIFVISKSKSQVDVLRHDGSGSHGLYSCSVGPVNIVDPRDFLPHQFVAQKGASDDDQENWK